MHESNYIVSATEAGRLDRFLAVKLGGLGFSRERIKSAIKGGCVLVDGRCVNLPRFELRANCVVAISCELGLNTLKPEEGELALIYADARLALVNKPPGLAVHPAPGLESGTLAHRLLSHFPALARQEGLRPGIVHRLDKDTSGLLLIALDPECADALSVFFAERKIFKEYLALVWGVPDKEKGLVEAPIGRHPVVKTKMAVNSNGKYAKSAWRIIHAPENKRYALLAIQIFTGRTHQIRVHMEYIGHPIVGDSVYTGNKVRAAPEKAVSPSLSAMQKNLSMRRGTVPVVSRQMLHAWRLAFKHPYAAGTAEISSPLYALAGGELRAVCPPPEDFMQALAEMEAKMQKIIVTGSPGSGKSTFLAECRRRGIVCFSADEEVKKQYEKNGHGHYLLKARFGDRFIPAEGGPVDKAALAEAMRKEPALRKEVESLLHPLVRHAMQEHWQKCEEAGSQWAVAEVPLYLEAGFASKRQEAGCREASGHAAKNVSKDEFAENRPLVVGIHCPFALRKERLMQTRGWSARLVADIESWQWPEEKKMAACDLVVNNSADLDLFINEIDLFFEKLSALATQRQEQFLTAVRKKISIP